MIVTIYNTFTVKKKVKLLTVKEAAESRDHLYLEENGVKKWKLAFYRFYKFESMFFFKKQKHDYYTTM